MFTAEDECKVVVQNMTEADETPGGSPIVASPLIRDDADNHADADSPTSSQFLRKGKTSKAHHHSGKQARGGSMRLDQPITGAVHTNKTQYDETLEEALIDLYLSVKIRSNEEIDAYNEKVLQEERERLQDTSPFTILEYIKTSIEILMNMKMEEHQDQMQAAKSKKKGSKPQGLDGGNPGMDATDTESVVSGDGPPADYE